MKNKVEERIRALIDKSTLAVMLVALLSNVIMHSAFYTLNHFNLLVDGFCHGKTMSILGLLIFAVIIMVMPFELYTLLLPRLADRLRQNWWFYIPLVIIESVDVLALFSVVEENYLLIFNDGMLDVWLYALAVCLFCVTQLVAMTFACFSKRCRVEKTVS